MQLRLAFQSFDVVVIAQRESVANVTQASHQSFGESSVGCLAYDRIRIPNTCDLIDRSHASVQRSVARIRTTMSVQNRHVSGGSHWECVINAAMIFGKLWEVGIHHRLPFRTHSRPPPRIDAMHSTMDQFDFTIPAIADSCVGMS